MVVVDVMVFVVVLLTVVDPVVFVVVLLTVVSVDAVEFVDVVVSLDVVVLLVDEVGNSVPQTSMLYASASATGRTRGSAVVAQCAPVARHHHAHRPAACTAASVPPLLQPPSLLQISGHHD